MLDTHTAAGCVPTDILMSDIGGWDGAPVDGTCTTTPPSWDAGCTTPVDVPCVAPESSGGAACTLPLGGLQGRQLAVCASLINGCSGGGRRRANIPHFEAGKHKKEEEWVQSRVPGGGKGSTVFSRKCNDMAITFRWFRFK